MIAINGYYNGSEYVSSEAVDVKPYQKVIITISNEFVDNNELENKRFRKYIGKLDDESFAEINKILKN